VRLRNPGLFENDVDHTHEVRSECVPTTGLPELANAVVSRQLPHHRPNRSNSFRLDAAELGRLQCGFDPGKNLDEESRKSELVLRGETVKAVGARDPGVEEIRGLGEPSLPPDDSRDRVVESLTLACEGVRSNLAVPSVGSSIGARSSDPGKPPRYS